MKTKIAGYKILPVNEYSPVFLMEREPSTKGYLQVTDWVEVELPDLSEAVIEGMKTVQTEARIAELDKQIADLRASRPKKEAA